MIRETEVVSEKQARERGTREKGGEMKRRQKGLSMAVLAGEHGNYFED